MNIRRAGGGGAPLVFIHGWGLSGAIWQKQMAHFSATHRVFAIDLPGHGASAPLDGALTIRRCGEETARFLEAERLEEATLVGWSLGTQAALYAALLCPARAAKLALVAGTPCFVSPSAADRWGTPAAKAKWFARQMRSDFENTLRAFILTFFETGEVAAPEEEAALKELFFAHLPDRAAALALLDDLYAEDMRDGVKRLSLPALVMHGTADRIVPFAAAALWETLLTPRPATVRFEGAGHAPFLTRADGFNRALEAFLK